jgi:hemerythrin
MSDPNRAMNWGAAYETGIPAIDCQHQSLFKALKNLHEAIHDRTVQAEACVVLDFLDKYARIHFTDEEVLMQRAGFPELSAHRAEHRSFQLRLHDLRTRYQGEPVGVSLETSMLLFEWFRDHILLQDMAFAEFTRKSATPVS